MEKVLYNAIHQTENIRCSYTHTGYLQTTNKPNVYAHCTFTFTYLHTDLKRTDNKGKQTDTNETHLLQTYTIYTLYLRLYTEPIIIHYTHSSNACVYLYFPFRLQWRLHIAVKRSTTHSPSARSISQ